MRTTLDLPDELLRSVKIKAVETGSTLRQIVVDALQREMADPARPRQRLERPPVKLSRDAPLRKLGPGDVKRLDAESVSGSDKAKAHALRR